MTKEELLTKTLSLPVEGWTTDSFAKDANNEPCSWYDTDVVKFCWSGYLYRLELKMTGTIEDANTIMHDFQVKYKQTLAESNDKEGYYVTKERLQNLY